MTPIPAINPGLSNLLSSADLLSPTSGAVPAGGIQMPLELGQTAATTPPTDSFSSMLGQMVTEVNNQQNASAQAVGALQSGQNIPLHHAVIAMEEANVSFQLMVEVRNRLLDSYQEIMRMQV
jgi:flagellar hook-basal body complex protein FliE